MTFYGVALQPTANNDGGDDKGKTDNSSSSSPSSLVLESKEEVLKLLKLHKGGRFKAFSTREEAEAFARSSSSSNVCKATATSDETLDEKGNSVSVSGEGCEFSGLTPQQLKGLKEAISRGDDDAIDAMVAENPRFLVTTCDAPSVLHSGTRSNALHFAAASGNVRTVRKVLDAVQDPALMRRMYPTESAEARSKRQEHLLDLYLNMPNKGHNDTPLHQAAKAGHLDVVRLLVSYSSCDTSRKNRDGLTPADVSCSRMSSSSVDQDVKREILKALSGQVYIPVIRDEDLVVPGFIGEPCRSPQHMMTGDDSFSRIGNAPVNFNLVLASPRPKSAFPSSSPLLNQSHHSPLLMTTDTNDVTRSPLQSPLSVRALFGPLAPEDAKAIREEWNTSLNKVEKLSDPLKGIERRGRELAKKYVTSLFEYWDFLDAYCDLSKPEGLTLLDNHLANTARSMEEDARRERQKELDDLDCELLFSTTGTNKKKQQQQKDDFLSPVSQLARDLDAFHVSSPPVLPEENDNDNNASNLLMGDGNGNSLTSSSLPAPLMREDSEAAATNDSFVSFSSKDSSTSSYETADGGVPLYINGIRPSRIDSQVFEILKGVAIDRNRFPNVCSWRETVSATEATLREAWGTGRGRRRPLLNVAKFNIEELT